jgi:hypothetical protein
MYAYEMQIGYINVKYFAIIKFYLYHLLEKVFDSNPQGWWMWFTFIKRMNNILILVIVRLGWIV